MIQIANGDFKANIVKLADLDLPIIGFQIQVGEDEIHAVLEVEASGSGYDSQGRPKMLFERHRFYKNLPAALRAEAVRLGLATVSWVNSYPKDSYPRLKEAMKLHPEAALKSASWGLPQILGENFKAAGYSDVFEMVNAFINKGEREHLQAMVNFIVANKLDDNLRAHDWDGFARGYNGPQYAVHGYHTKLAAAFKKWQKIKDTYWDGKIGMPPPSVTVVAGAVEVKPTVVALPSPSPVPVIPPPPPAKMVTVDTPSAKPWWQRFIDALQGRA
jgi:hypothetical protein